MVLCAASNILEALFDNDTGACVRLDFVDNQAVMTSALIEDRSSLNEEISFKDGIVAVRHTLTLVADRNLAEAWLEPAFCSEAVLCGLCAVVTLNDGCTLLVGCSERFGTQQPLRPVSIVSSSGSRLADMPTLTLTLESYDTSAAAICETFNG